MDLKKMSMSELIAKHNELAVALNVSPESSFKSLAAARSAVESLVTRQEKAMTQETQTPEVPFDGATPVAETSAAVASVVHTLGDTDRSKYNSSGKRGPNQGVGAFAKELIQAGKTNAEALAIVLAKFPGAKTTTGCIAFYRTALTKAGQAQGPSPEALRKQAEELLAKAASVEAAAKAKAEAEAKTKTDAEAAAAAKAAESVAEPAPM